MAFVLLGLSGIVGIVSLCCYIYTVVKMFQNQDTTYGILSLVLIVCGIGPLLALIRGWQKKDEWDIANVINIWLAAVVIGILVQVGSLALGGSAAIPTGAGR